MQKKLCLVGITFAMLLKTTNIIGLGSIRICDSATLNYHRK
jgi:hypothetical protein